MEILGRKIVENLPFDQVESVFMERDYRDRSVLNIITDNNIMSFIVIRKLKFLIDKIWDGKDSDLLDGKTSHFSKTKYLLYHQIKTLKGVQTKITDIIGSNFRPNIEDYNFLYQFKFRLQSIQILFIKEFICATAIVLVFQYINYSYLNLFTKRRYSFTDDYQEQLTIIGNNLHDYRFLATMGTTLSISYFISFLGRIIYNSYSRRKIFFDLWLLFDLLACVVNLVTFNIIASSSPETMLVEEKKRFYDYYMIVVLIISWLRFFSYFLVINRISKVTLTLIMMLKETLNFLLILGCYLILMTTIFATLFRDCQTEDAQDYKELMPTLRALIDYFLANYKNKQMANYETSHSVMVIAHVVISNMFLLNFLVAILTTVYDIMNRNGDFYAIEYQYKFILKYMKALEENNGYDKLVLYPPPLNFFLLPLLLVSFSRNLTRKVSLYISYFFYWFENIFLIIAFFFYLWAHNPLVMVKIQY